MEDWSMWAGLRTQEPFHWKSDGGRPDVSPSKKRPPLSLALSAALLENRALLETWSCSKRAPSLNIWPSLNIEPTLSQISEETLESLKLRERNSRASNSTQRQPTNNRRASPEWHHATTRGIPSSHTDHLNKSSIKQPLFCWNWSYLSLKLKY